MIEFLPAVMPDSFKDLRHKLEMVAHHVSWAQIDIMDGKFVKSRSWPYFSNDIHSFENLLAENEGLPFWEKLEFEIDLMVK
jgi:pentose-5-phosphate-3-epimerase